MVNLLGDLWASGSPCWESVLRRPNARLHLYGKQRATPGRKMGHVLLLDEDVQSTLGLVDELLASLDGHLPSAPERAHAHAGNG